MVKKTAASNPAELYQPQPAPLGIARYRLSLPRDRCRHQLGQDLSRSQRINFSTVFAGQAVGIKEVHDDIWLVRFMDYDLGYFDLETRVLEPLDNPFGPRLSPM